MPASIADVKAAVRAILAYKFDGEGSREVEDYAKSDPELYAALKLTYLVAAIRLSGVALGAPCRASKHRFDYFGRPRVTSVGGQKLSYDKSLINIW